VGSRKTATAGLRRNTPIAVAALMSVQTEKLRNPIQSLLRFL